MAGIVSSLTGSNTNQGGILPGQQQLANFQGSEGMLNNANAFGGQNNQPMGMSTNLSMADAGTQMAKALFEQQMSQSDAIANANFQNAQSQQKASLIGNLGSTLGGSSSTSGSMGTSSGGLTS